MHLYSFQPKLYVCGFDYRHIAWYVIRHINLSRCLHRRVLLANTCLASGNCDIYTTYYVFELFFLFVRFSTGCRARSPGKSGRGPAPGSSVHCPAVPSDARCRGAAGSARKAARTGSIARGRFFHHPRIYGERVLFFLRRDHDPETSDSRTSCSSSSSSSAQIFYNQLSPTLQRYRAQQQQETPCACDRSALYCVCLLYTSDAADE